MKLTAKELWDERHTVRAGSLGTENRTRKGLIRKIVDDARHKQGAQIGQSYSRFLLERLLKAHLPIRPDWTAMEIGCAPATW